MSRRLPQRLVVVAGLVVALGLGVVVAPFASSSPDGLERVAQDEGFADAGITHGVQESAPVPDYAFPGVEDERAATGLAGVAGVTGIFFLTAGLGLVIRRRRWARSPHTAST